MITYKMKVYVITLLMTHVCSFMKSFMSAQISDGTCQWILWHEHHQVKY